MSCRINPGMELGPCIYGCGHAADGREHPVSAGLGSFEGQERLKDRTCTPCNNDIGRDVEEPFLRSGLIGHFRWITGFPRGYSDDPASSPYSRGASGFPPVKLVGTFPGTGHDSLFYVLRGSIDRSPLLRQLRLVTEAGETILVPLPDSIRTADDVRGAVRKAGAEGARPVSMIDHEEQSILAVIREVYPGISGVTSTSVKADESRVEMGAEVIMGPPHFRAIAKIGFHYFLQHFSHRFRGDEPAFEPIRAFIRHGQGNPTDFVRERRDQLAMNFDGGRQPGRWTHIVCASVSPSSIVATCQFFIGPRFMHPGWDVMIASDYSRIIAAADVRSLSAHAFVYHADDGHELDGVMVDLQPVDHVLIPRSV